MPGREAVHIRIESGHQWLRDARIRKLSIRDAMNSGCTGVLVLDVPADTKGFDRLVSDCLGIVIEGWCPSRTIRLRIRSCDLLGWVGGRLRVRLRLAHVARDLQRIRRSRILDGQSPASVADVLLRDAPQAQTSVEIRDLSSERTIECFTQYNETDWSAFLRLLGMSGGLIAPDWRNAANDHVRAGAANAVLDAAERGAAALLIDESVHRDEILALRCTYGLTRRRVTVTALDPSDPAALREGETIADHGGTAEGMDVRHWASGGEVLRDEAMVTGLKKQSQAFMRRALCAESGLELTTMRPDLPLGAVIRLPDAPGELAEQRWRVVEVRQRARCAVDAGMSGSDFRMITRVRLIPASVDWHPIALRPRRTSGVLIGEVVGPDGADVDVDRIGRVRVQFPWNEGRAANARTAWVRVLQPSASSNHGTVHVPRIGSRVVVGFLGGDVSAPVVLGQVFHGGSEPALDPTVAQGAEEWRVGAMRGGSGCIVIVANPEPGKERLELSAPNEIRQHAGERLYADARTIELEASDRIVLRAGSSELTLDAQQGITLNGSRVALKAAGDLSVNGAVVKLNC